MARVNNPKWFKLSFEELERLDMICSICLNVFLNPVQSHNDDEDPCGHVFCKSCISQWLQKNSHCPICCSPLRIEQLLIDGRVKRKISQLSVICHIDASICNSKGELGKAQLWWKKHDKVCKYKNILCPICAIQQTRGKLVQHLSNDCENVFIECKLGCGEAIKRKNIDKHDKECSSGFTSCEYCHDPVLKSNLVHHEKRICPKAKINCKYSLLGCQFFHLREEKKKKNKPYGRENKISSRFSNQFS